MVRDGDRRRILFDLDRAIQDITPAREPDPASSSAILTLTNIYHNLVRQWADA
jgi:PKHD-type hydroxylase